MTKTTRRGFLRAALAGVAAAGLGLGLTPKPRKGVQGVDPNTPVEWSVHVVSFTKKELLEAMEERHAAPLPAYPVPSFINEDVWAWGFEATSTGVRVGEQSGAASADSERLRRLYRGVWA